MNTVASTAVARESAVVAPRAPLPDGAGHDSATDRLSTVRSTTGVPGASGTPSTCTVIWPVACRSVRAGDLRRLRQHARVPSHLGQPRGAHVSTRAEVVVTLRDKSRRATIVRRTILITG